MDLPDGSYGTAGGRVALSEDERETLVRSSRRSTSAQNLAQRCRIVSTVGVTRFGRRPLRGPVADLPKLLADRAGRPPAPP
jgi:hypothetical protein